MTVYGKSFTSPPPRALEPAPLEQAASPPVLHPTRVAGASFSRLG